MAQAQIWMALVLFVLWCIIIRTGSMLYPIVTYREMHGNEAYVNASIQDIGDHDFNKTYLIQFEALREIRDIKTLFSYSVRALDGVIENALLTRWIDGCEFLRRPSSNRLLKIFFDTVKNHSKISRCPFPRGEIVMLNITPSNFLVPDFVPETDFLIEVKGYIRARKILAFATRWYGSLTSTEHIKTLYKAQG